MKRYIFNLMYSLLSAQSVVENVTEVGFLSSSGRASLCLFLSFHFILFPCSLLLHPSKPPSTPIPPGKDSSELLTEYQSRRFQANGLFLCWLFSRCIVAETLSDCISPELLKQGFSPST